MRSKSSSIIVQKFGGTSVGSPERILNVAKRAIETAKHYENVVIVVSAMGDTTDDLIELAKKITPSPNPREYDALISTGENISAALVAMAIHSMGHEAISLTGPQAGIETEEIYGKAKILSVKCDRIESELAQKKIVIVTGFQGRNALDDVTTIGRGGSDTSAVVLAAALGSPICEIYTDVDGVYTTDPRAVKTASKLHEISYDEMLELASLGAKVLHPRSVEVAKENNIMIHVRSSFSTETGTLVKENSQMEVKRPVTGITLSTEESMLSLSGLTDKPGFAGKLFTNMANATISVDMIIQSAQDNGKNTITFTVHQDDLDQATQILKQTSQELGAEAVISNPSIAKVSIVGVGMISKPGVAAKMFQVLGDQNINLKLISTSEIKISCAINREDGKKALQALHDAFELDAI
jgi:aspartate kinase